VAEGFCELDLPTILGLEGYADLTTPADRAHWLEVFLLVFRRESFIAENGEKQTFHQISLDDGRRHEERVAKDLSRVVFVTVFPPWFAASRRAIRKRRKSPAPPISRK
jgi:hypothetical protein